MPSSPSEAHMDTGYGGGRQKHPRISPRYEDYQQGDSVTVVQSSGAVETDWTFSHQRMDTAEIVVKKTVRGRLRGLLGRDKELTKELSPHQFREMQNQ